MLIAVLEQCVKGSLPRDHWSLVAVGIQSVYLITESQNDTCSTMPSKLLKRESP